MRVDIIAFQYLHKLHFDCVAAAISYSTLGARSNDEIVVVIGSTLLLTSRLLNSTDGIFPDVSRKPLIHRSTLHAQALKFIDHHWPDLQKGPSKEIFNTPLGRGQLHSVHPGTSCVL